MGQKVHPIGFRLATNKNWKSRWFRVYGYSDWLVEDYKIRKFLKTTQKSAGIASIIIERAGEKCKVGIYVSKPGLIIGKKGLGIEQLKYKLKHLCNSDVFINIYEIKIPEINAQLIAESIAQQIEKRASFRRSIKRAIAAAQKMDIHGIKIACSGRLGGVEMSRREWYREGRVPLHTIRADINYAFSYAETAYGLIGCKVWLFKGEVI
jgi:small subunit ribosomal protein S3